jgi:hypothetical protein
MQAPPAARVVPLLLAAAALARDTPDNAHFFMQQGQHPTPKPFPSPAPQRCHNFSFNFCPAPLRFAQEPCLPLSNPRLFHPYQPSKKHFPAQFQH